MLVVVKLVVQPKAREIASSFGDILIIPLTPVFSLANGVIRKEREVVSTDDASGLQQARAGLIRRGALAAVLAGVALLYKMLYAQTGSASG